jgi:uncharacterized protein (TIGR02246 family)
MRTLIGGVVALMAAASPSLVSEKGPAARPMPSVEARLRVLEDKEAIHAVMMTYGRTLDGRDFAGFERLWAKDAEFIGGVGGRATGPAAIRALLEGLLKANAAPVPGRDFHLFYNETIEVSGDQATALSKGAFVVPGPNNRLEMSILANYHDQFVREDGRWKFKRRQIGEDPPPATAAR